MDNETRHLNSGDAARAPGAPAPLPAPPAAAPGPGTPTNYLPPMNAPANGAPGGGASYGAPSAGPGYAPPSPPFGTTYAAPNADPGYAAAGGGAAYPAPAAGPGAPGPAPAWSGPAWAGHRGRHGLWPLALIVVGLLVLTGRFHTVFGAAIPLALGLVFLYVSTQGSGRWGFRIPGCILTGLGAGIVLETMGLGGGGYSAVGLGLGFIALWAWDRSQWWWLIPGAVVGLGGLEGVMSSSGWSSGMLAPLALVALGAYLLSGRRWRSRA